jgi:hypothetical protein
MALQFRYSRYAPFPLVGNCDPINQALYGTGPA